MNDFSICFWLPFLKSVAKIITLHRVKNDHVTDSPLRVTERGNRVTKAIHRTIRRIAFSYCYVSQGWNAPCHYGTRMHILHRN